MAGMAPSFAFIGFGEAGSNVAGSLRAEGVERIATYDILFDDPAAGPALRKKAEDMGVRASDSIADAVVGVDIVFSTVVCKSSIPVAEEAGKHLTPEQFYLDFNSISPGNKRRVAAAVAPSGARFVEASVMADVSSNAHRVPMLLGGAGARDFMALVEPLDFNLTFVQEQIGQASATKMVRSIMMKGMAALHLECMRAANHFGIEQDVLDSVDKSLSGMTWTETCGRTLGRTAIHAARRADEMGQVAETLREVGIDPMMAEATERRHRWCAALGLKEVYKDGPVDDYRDVLEKICAAETKEAAE
jgi:3-hydroxyisobutyrate dehydrogenase-like beta-hydroxyacid dehydrogenase